MIQRKKKNTIKRYMFYEPASAQQSEPVRSQRPRKTILIIVVYHGGGGGSGGGRHHCWCSRCDVDCRRQTSKIKHKTTTSTAHVVMNSMLMNTMMMVYDDDDDNKLVVPSYDNARLCFCEFKCDTMRRRVAIINEVEPVVCLFKQRLRTNVSASANWSQLRGSSSSSSMQGLCLRSFGV